jgi:acyl-[acyl-carrier-protein]-phospholipid O-acyltransferase/long-chain-fatty-acid--[acyl-carrier-protein] ligase
VEQKILAALELCSEGDRTLAVTSVADPQKGEALVLLSNTRSIRRSCARGCTTLVVPNLWIPKIILRVEQIPVWRLVSSILRRCSEIAAMGGSESGS